MESERVQSDFSERRHIVQAALTSAIYYTQRQHSRIIYVLPT